MTRWRRDRSGKADTVSDRVWELGGHGFAGHLCDIACRWWQRGRPKRIARATRYCMRSGIAPLSDADKPTEALRRGR